MSDQKPHASNFWFGFAIGTVSAATIGYLLGTKKGREKLKRFIELSENLEEKSPDLMQTIQEVLKEMQHHEVQEGEVETPQETASTTPPQNATSIENVMDKIKNASTTTKKFFEKK